MSNRSAVNYLKCNNIFRSTCTPSNEQQLEPVDLYGNTALLKACFLGNVEAVRELLSSHANLYAINYFGQNALTLATYAGSYDTVCELLKHRSYDDFTLSSMIPPICVALLKEHYNLVELFENINLGGEVVPTVHGITAGELEEMQNPQD